MPIFAFYIGEGRWQDRAIRRATGAIESHVEYVVGGQVAHENLCISASKRDGNKVRAKLIEWRPEHWSFVEVPGDDDAIYRRMQAELDKPYDTLGAILSVTPICTSRPDKWFCSEIMAHSVGLPKPHRFTPGSFRDALLELKDEPVKEAAK